MATTLRQIALDTETTGKSDDGSPGEHRIIEIGCVEIVDRRITQRNFHIYLNPERAVDEEATRVHGLTLEHLKDKPRFSNIVEEFVDFIRGSELLIHNAKFDVSFLDMELERCGYMERIQDLATVTDTVALAIQLHPNHQVSLDNLCKLFGISLAQRKLHGALLDAELLAEVYLAMTGGQSKFEFQNEVSSVSAQRWQRPQGLKLPIMGVESARHALHVNKMVELAQSVKFKTEGEQAFAGSAWGDEYTMPYLAKAKEESGGDYKKRLKAQKQEKLAELLTSSEQEALAQAQAEDAQAYKKWEDRVLGRVSH